MATGHAVRILVVVLFLVLQWCKVSEGQRIGLLTTEVDMRYRADVQLRLNETGRFESVSFLNESATPTLEELVQNFEALLVWSGILQEPSDFITINMQPFPEPEVWGDLLQGFVEQGGGVVLAVAGFSGEHALKGAFASNSSVILPQSDHEITITESGGTGHKEIGVYLPEHPTMHDITSFRTTGIAVRTNMLPSQVKRMAEGSYAVAAFDDGVLLMAVRDEIGPNKTNRVDLNFHPVSRRTSTDYDAPGRRAGGWERSTQGAELMANALYYSMSGCGSFAPQPLTIITCSEGMSENITVEQGMTVEAEREMAVLDFSNSSSLHVVGTCHGPINITQSPAAGTLLAVGLHNITVQVEDALGSLVQCTTTFNFTLITVDPASSEEEGSSSKSSASGSESDATDAAERESDTSSDSNLPLILGLTIGLLFLAILVAAIVVAVLLRRRQSKAKKTRRMQKDLEDGTENMYQRNPIQPRKKLQTGGFAEHGERGMGFSWNIQFSELTLGEEIGRGGFGVVMKGKWRGTAVAIKQILAKHNNELQKW